MYGNLALLDKADNLEKGERVYLGDLPGKNEAWLRDTLFQNPEIIPIDDIDATSGHYSLCAKNFALMLVRSMRRSSIGTVD